MNQKVDLTNLRGEFKANLDELEEHEIEALTANFLSRTLRIPYEILDKKPHILNIEQDTRIAARIFTPSCCRDFQAYVLSANGVFEYARIERED